MARSTSRDSVDPEEHAPPGDWLFGSIFWFFAALAVVIVAFIALYMGV